MTTVALDSMSVDDRALLERWTRSRIAPFRLVLRSRIVMLAAQGYSNNEIARVLSTSTNTVALWRRRYAEQGVRGLQSDAPGRGRKPAVD